MCGGSYGFKICRFGMWAFRYRVLGVSGLDLAVSCDWP